MNINELDSYDLGDAVKFNKTLNPRLWTAEEHLRPEVREQLLKIAEDFAQTLGINNLQLKDITVSGSNAAYTYTPHSDIDLHLVVDLPEADASEVYRELFDAKKYQYNDMHNIKIGGYDVELYVQDANKPHISQGIYSVLNDDWVEVPKRRRPAVDDISTRSKYETLLQHVEQAIDTGDYKQISALADKIKRMRQAGLEEHGEFGPENLAFKMLRSQGVIEKLYSARNQAKDHLLSLDERQRQQKKQPVKYGFGGYWYPGTGYAGQDTPAAQEAGDDINEAQELAPSNEDVLKDFIKFCVAELKIETMPAVKLRKDPQWSVVNKTFGRYNNDKHMLEVAWGHRHIMDILRTVAHELTHKHQHERDGERMGPDAGETGSPWENEANARAGILMRDYARLHPDFFALGQAHDLAEQEVDESLKGKTAAAALAACMTAGGTLSGCATQPSVQGGLQTAQEVGRTVQTAQRMTRAGVQDELSQELRNFIRATGGDAGSQNQSVFYKLFKQQQNESASGYIPTKKQAKDPRYSMALTQDIKPGQVGKEANKLKLRTDRQGHPQLANPNGLFEKLMLELAEFKKPQNTYKLNQPLSQVPGEVEDDLGNQEATGPEFPPQWPEGTTKIDVSDLTDWYRLGMDISDMDDADPADYNQGPPQTVVVFPTDDIEQGYLPQFKRLGLKTHDIDSGQEHKPGQKQPKKNLAEEQLDEVRMAPSNLQQWAKSPEAQGIRAGFEAELIFRDTNSGDNDNSDMEPDYDMDERCRSINQVVEFFQSDDYGYGLNERQAARLQDNLDEQYMEWLDEQMYSSWRDERDELIKEAWLREKPMSERVHDFLVNGMDMDDREADRIQEVGDKAPKFNSSKEQAAYSQENPDYATYLEATEGAEEILDEDVEQTISKEDGFYDEVLDDFRNDFYMDDDSGFFDDVGLRWMSDVSNSYDLGWPYLMGSGSNGGSREWDEIGASLQDTVDMRVNVSTNYHSTARRENQWVLEPDSSLEPDDSEDFGLEVVSPPMPLEQALEKLQEVTDWANNPSEGNAYTNGSTGLHMGVSVPFKGGDVDYLKLILFLGDEYVLKSFGREANTYTKSAMSKFRENIKGGRADPAGAMKLMQSNLIEFAYREIQKGVGEGKYTSAHIQKGYIEFRSAGGDWLAEGNAEPGKLENTMLRYARAMSLAADPSAERREYAKKLYKLIAPEGDSQLALFSQFAAGELTAEQLKKRWAEKTIGAEKKMNQRWKLLRKSPWGTMDPVPGAEWNGYTEDQVKNAVWSKYGREALDSGEYELVNTGEEQQWEVYNVDTGETLEIVKGKSKGEAADAVFDKYAEQGIGFNVRPYQDPATMTPRAKLAKRITQTKKPTDYNYDIIDRRTVELKVVDQFYATDEKDASETFDRWLKLKGLPQDEDAYGYRKGRPQQAVKDVEPDVAQNFNQPQDATDVPRDWEFVNRINGQVIHNMSNASYNQANVVQTNLESRYPDADIYLRSVSNLEENFADGKNPQDKGDSVRHGIPKGATMAQLEKAAKAPGRKGQLARWQINMRRGKKK